MTRISIRPSSRFAALAFGLLLTGCSTDSGDSSSSAPAAGSDNAPAAAPATNAPAKPATAPGIQSNMKMRG